MDLFIIDCFTTAIFTLEAILKIVTLGFLFCGKNSFLRNSWNILDFIIVIFSIIGATPYVDSIQVIKMLRIMRILRIIGKNEGL
jgi:Trk-type K+ transport system membrane component